MDSRNYTGRDVNDAGGTGGGHDEPMGEPGPLDGWAPLDPRWLSDAPPAREYLLSMAPNDTRAGYREPVGVIPRGRVGLLVSAGGVGKSWICILLALAVATGRRWLDTFEPCTMGRVLLLLAEEEPAEVRRRIYQAGLLLRLTETERADAAHNIVALGLSGNRTQLVDEDGDLSEFCGDLTSHLDDGGPPWCLAILDPLSRFGGAGFEKDNAQATALVEVLERLTAVKGHPTVITAHHTSQSDRLRGGASAVSARGVTATVDGARFVLALEALDPYPRVPDLVRLNFVKGNYTARIEPVDLVRDPDHEGAMRRATKNETDDYKNAEVGAKAAVKATKAAVESQAKAQAKMTLET